MRCYNVNVTTSCFRIAATSALMLLVSPVVFGQCMVDYIDGGADNNAITLTAWTTVTDYYGMYQCNPPWYGFTHTYHASTTIYSPSGRSTNNTSISSAYNGGGSTIAYAALDLLNETGTFTVDGIDSIDCSAAGENFFSSIRTRLFSGGVITSSYVKVGEYGDGTAGYDKNCQAGTNYARACGDGNYRLPMPGYPHSFAHMPFYFISIGTNGPFKCAGPGSPVFDSGPPRCSTAP